MLCTFWCARTCHTPKKPSSRPQAEAAEGAFHRHRHLAAGTAAAVPCGHAPHPARRCALLEVSGAVLGLPTRSRRGLPLLAALAVVAAGLHGAEAPARAAHCCIVGPPRVKRASGAGQHSRLSAASGTRYGWGSAWFGGANSRVPRQGWDGWTMPLCSCPTRCDRVLREAQQGANELLPPRAEGVAGCSCRFYRRTDAVGTKPAAQDAILLKQRHGGRRRCQRQCRLDRCTLALPVS